MSMGKPCGRAGDFRLSRSREHFNQSRCLFETSWKRLVMLKLAFDGVVNQDDFSTNLIYSVLSALTGSTDAARRAGIIPAAQAAASSIPTATTNEPLLTVVSSNNC